METRRSAIPRPTVRPGSPPPSPARNKVGHEQVVKLGVLATQLAGMLEVDHAFVLGSRRVTKGVSWSTASDWWKPGTESKFRQPDGDGARRVAEWIQTLSAGVMVTRAFSTADQNSRSWMAGAGVKSWALVPLKAGGRLVAVLGFEDYGRERLWSAGELGLVREFTRQAESSMRPGSGTNQVTRSQSPRDRTRVGKPAPGLKHVGALPAVAPGRLKFRRASAAIVDSAGRVAFWSPEAEEVFGWSASRLLGRRATDTLYSGSTAHFALAMAAVRNLGSWTGELGHTLENGRRQVFRCRWTLTDPVRRKFSPVAMEVDQLRQG
ncbi:MAG: GAF domain-containing protein [Limisphaerales bacterium]